MSLLREYSVLCDGPTHPNCHVRTSTRALKSSAARREALRRGWKRVKVEGRWKKYHDLCPECARP